MVRREDTDVISLVEFVEFRGMAERDDSTFHRKSLYGISFLKPDRFTPISHTTSDQGCWCFCEIWIELALGVGAHIVGACGSDRGRVMDR